MECPFHAGNESISTCVQCSTPICPICVSETNQVHLCLNCYRARVEQLSAGLGSASARLSKERKKTEAKVSRGGRKKKGEAAVPAQAAKPSFEVGAEEALWEKDQSAPLAAMAAPVMAPGTPYEPPLSKKELARMKKEEAKRLKMEEKAAKKSAEIIPEQAPPPMPEAAPFFEPPTPPPSFEAPPEPPSFAPPPAPEPPAEGVKFPPLDERLEPLPPREDTGGAPPPPDLEPPEGFFD